MINLGLTRITALVSYLPTKQTWKAIHIAGTNGKGGVAAYLSSLFLRLSRPHPDGGELKIGRFTSPHLIDRWDCITINDQPVSESMFLQVEREVMGYAEKAAADLRKKKSHDGDESETVTEFELLTATAFEIFSQQNCQVAVIECGLGGRLDATNVLKAKDVACTVITKIGLDHVGILGDTIEAIAREKAGITKHNVPMVVDGTNHFTTVEAMAIVANGKNVAPYLSRRPDVEDHWHINHDQVIGHMPPHQYNNLILALTAFAKSKKHIPDLSFMEPSELNLRTILQDVRTSYPARLQHLSISTLYPHYTHPILLDGAHNPQSAEVLKSYLDSLTSSPKSSGLFKSRVTSHTGKPPNKPRTWVLAMSRSKDVTQILSTMLEPHDNVVCVHFSRVDGMPWVTSLETSTLATAARMFADKGTIREASDVLEGLQIGTEMALESRKKWAELHDEKTRKKVPDQKEEIEVVVAGSLYLASDLLRAMRDGPDSVTSRFGIGVAV